MRLPFTLFAGVLLVVLLVALLACRPTPGKPPLPTTVGQSTRSQPVLAPRQIITGTSAASSPQAPPTLADLWAGDAQFIVDVPVTGLPMGESDTLLAPDGGYWSYVHASDRSAGVIDQCGAPVEFPGCVVIYRSADAITFQPDDPAVCQIACNQCPCSAADDHIIQQQYPRVVAHEDHFWMVYEFQGRVMVRDSPDGVTWSQPTWVADSLVWHLWYADCPAEERIGEHPFAPFDYECLRGGPPGLFIADQMLYLFMAQGQNPGAMGCFKRAGAATEDTFQPCAHNPLFVGAAEYGPIDRKDATTNLHFDFRTISSAEVVKIGTGDNTRFYMLYEGVRGPGANDPGDTQFGLGLARSRRAAIDGPWEKYPANPLLVDLPGNIGLGHADLIELAGVTYLYTSLDGETRSRLRLVWNR